MKTCKTGCGGKMTMSKSGKVAPVKKMAKGGQALNNAKGYAKPQTGGDNVKMGIYGIPNAGRTDSLGFKKGGTVSVTNRAVSAGCTRGMVKDANGKCVNERAKIKFKLGGFKDLSGDGKITKKDVLIGRGVIKKPIKKK